MKAVANQRQEVAVLGEGGEEGAVEWRGVLEEEDFEVESSGSRNYVVVLVRVLEEEGEGVGELFGVVELGEGGGEGEEVVEVGEEGVVVVEEGGGEGGGEGDGVVGVAVAVLEGSPFCGHGSPGGEKCSCGLL